MNEGLTAAERARLTTAERARLAALLGAAAAAQDGDAIAAALADLRRGLPAMHRAVAELAAELEPETAATPREDSR